MKERKGKDIFEPGVHETPREAFRRVDRECAGLPPEGYRSWDQYAAEARQDYQANIEIRESIDDMETQIESEVQESHLAYWKTRLGYLNEDLAQVNRSIERLRAQLSGMDATRGYEIRRDVILRKIAQAKSELADAPAKLRERRGA